MSIVEVHELAGRTSTLNWKFQRTYTRKWIVISSTRFEDPITVETASGIPLVQAAYPTDPFALVTDKSAAQQADMKTWVVTVNYNTSFDQDPANFVEDPLSRPAVFEADFERTTRAFQFDKDGDPILATNGLPYDPPLEADVSPLTITITKNQASGSVAAQAALQDVINSDAFLGFGVRQLKLRVSAKQKQDNGILYFEWKYTLSHNPFGWRKKVLDMGYHYKDSDGELVKARDVYGDPVASPVLLDGFGGFLPDGGTPVFNEFKFYQETGFSGVVPII